MATPSLTSAAIPNTPSQPTVTNIRKEWSWFISSRTDTDIDLKQILEKLRPSNLGDIPERKIPKMKKTRSKKNSTYCSYLNRLSAAFRDQSSAETVYVFATPHYALQSHTTSSSDKWG
jgi:hypothetical protein